MKIIQAEFPKVATDRTPKYVHRIKVPVVGAKIGPKIITLIADGHVFDSLSVRTEAKVIISDIYIAEIESARDGAIPTPPKKKGLFARLRKDKEDKK